MNETCWRWQFHEARDPRLQKSSLAALLYLLAVAVDGQCSGEGGLAAPQLMPNVSLAHIGNSEKPNVLC